MNQRYIILFVLAIPYIMGTDYMSSYVKEFEKRVALLAPIADNKQPQLNEKQSTPIKTIKKIHNSIEDGSYNVFCECLCSLPNTEEAALPHYDFLRAEYTLYKTIEKIYNANRWNELSNIDEDEIGKMAPISSFPMFKIDVSKGKTTFSEDKTIVEHFFYETKSNVELYKIQDDWYLCPYLLGNTTPIDKDGAKKFVDWFTKWMYLNTIPNLAAQIHLETNGKTSFKELRKIRYEARKEAAKLSTEEIVKKVGNLKKEMNMKL